LWQCGVFAVVSVSSSSSEEPRSEMERLTNGEDSWGLNEAKGLPHERKVAVIYTLLAACVADPHEVTGDTASTSVEGASKGDITVKAGYDARQRVALRLLVLWLVIDWIKVVSSLHFFVPSFLPLFQCNFTT
jgi:hypothetical protein